jgi:hypothetical protein
MSWATSLSELRMLLNDGPTDKYRDKKRLLGKVDGTNKLFKSLEFRRITNFTSATAPLGVYVSEVLASVASDDPDTGNVTLTTAPTDGNFVESSYYVQWFIDSEITFFLQTATRWLQSSTDQTEIPPGLQPAALNYAASEAYQKLALKFAETQSSTFRLEDAPDPKATSVVDEYKKTSLEFRTKALSLRDEFYTRQGQSLQPLFKSLGGRVSDVPPRR